jgi:outer membrane murein-binding lipoprotein Lpp
MHDYAGIIIALIGAAGGITGSYFMAESTADARVNEVHTQVQVLTERQSLQYSELKGDVTTIKADVKEVLRAVK